MLEEIKQDFENIRNDFDKKIQAITEAINALNGQQTNSGIFENPIMHNVPMEFANDLLEAASKTPRGGGIRKDL
jgi:hypothetical protein